ncbi:tRNA-dihydrouridine synthase, partial [Oligoflexia bacterium]|nr:tRNA-dihydrouridine synthase [Oligoflexia bacterium]
FKLLLDCLSACPVDFATLHARRGTQSYANPIDLNALRLAAETLPFPVIGNGDIWTPADAVRMLSETKVRGLMCGRGAIANPYLFLDIRAALNQDNTCINNRAERQLELQQYTLKLLNEYEQASKKEDLYTGAFKEACAWLDKNPLLGNGLFGAIKRLQSFEDIKAAIARYFKSLSPKASGQE